TYFQKPDLTSPLFQRKDATVDFAWGMGSPDPRIPPGGPFSVVWQGQVEALYNETYTFTTLSDDGIRLWVNEKRLIDNWTDHPPTEDSGTIPLKAYRKYDIRIEYYQGVGDSAAKLYWSSPSQVKEIVPQRQLYSRPPGEMTR